MFSRSFVTLSLSLLALFTSAFFLYLECSSIANQTSAPNARSTKGKKEGGKEWKRNVRRSKKERHVRLDKKEKKEEERTGKQDG